MLKITLASRLGLTSAAVLVAAATFTAGATAATLSGAVTPTPLDAPQDLTANGEFDWTIWGYGNSGMSNSLTPDDRKTGVTAAIADLVSVNPQGYALRGLGQFHEVSPELWASYSWTDGTSVVSEAEGYGGLQHVTGGATFGVGSGFTGSIAVGNTLTRVYIYMGVHAGEAEFQATLSDGGAAALVISDVGDFTSPNQNVVATIDVQGDSALTTLDFSWLLTAGPDAGTQANTFVTAIALGSPDAPPTTDPASPWSANGDITGSGTFNVVDALCAQICVLKGTCTGGATPACLQGPASFVDFNCDGSCDVNDVQLAIIGATGAQLSAAIDSNGDNIPDLCQD